MGGHKSSDKGISLDVEGGFDLLIPKYQDKTAPATGGWYKLTADLSLKILLITIPRCKNCAMAQA
jgi:hypothetical protein